MSTGYSRLSSSGDEDLTVGKWQLAEAMKKESLPEVKRALRHVS